MIADAMSQVGWSRPAHCAGARESKVLALHIIEEQFGNLVHDVATVLAERGRMRLSDLLQQLRKRWPNPGRPLPPQPATAWSAAHVKDALLVLIQHRLARSHRPARRDDASGSVSTSSAVASAAHLYELLPEEAVLRLRFPAFSRVARRDFGHYGYIIMKVLGTHGRLGEEELITEAEHTRLDMRAQSGEAPEEHPKDGSLPEGSGEVEPEVSINSMATSCRDEWERTLTNMVRSGLLQKCDVGSQSSGAPGSRDDTAGASNANARTTETTSNVAARIQSHAAEDVKVEAPGEATHIEQPASKRMRVGRADGGHGTESDGDVEAAASSVSDSQGGLHTSVQVLYEPCAAALHSRLLHSAIEAHVADKLRPTNGHDINRAAIRVLKAAFKLAAQHPRYAKPFAKRIVVATGNAPDVECHSLVEEGGADGNTAVVSVGAIVAALAAGEAGERDAGSFADGDTQQGPEKHITELDVRDAMRLLDTEAVVTRKSVRSARWGVWLLQTSKLVDDIQAAALHSMIVDKYGRDSARIVRVLMEHRNLEEKQVSEFAMIPVKDTRERLYALLRAQFILLREVHKRSDYQPQHTFFLWSVDAARMRKRLEAQLLQTLHRLRVRLLHEYDTNSDLIARAGQLGEQPKTDEARRFNAVNDTLDKLEQAILRVDKTYMLFSAF